MTRVDDVDRVAAARRLLPLIWAGEDIEARATALLAEALDVDDVVGECAALYALIAQAALGGEHRGIRDLALRLAQRAMACGQMAWQSIGHQYLSRVHLREGHEALAIQELAVAEVLLDDADHTVVLASALNGIAATYSALSLYEECERIYARAVTVIADVHDVWAEEAVTYNRLLNEVTWAVALERAEQSERARTQLARAGARHRAEQRPIRDPGLRGSIEALLLFTDLLTDGADVEAADATLARLTAQHALEPESYVRFALGLRLATAGRFDAARAQVDLGLASCQAIDGELIQTALVWLRARIAADESPDHQGCQDLWAYARLQTVQVWELRLRRHASAQDRTALERLQRDHRQVERQSLEDPLTGIANRRRLDLARDSLAIESSGDWAAVLYIDIDGFKAVNDTFGHDVGDRIIRTVTGLLAEQLRDGDLIGRYGGDELVVVAPGCEPTDVDRLADRLVVAVRSHLWEEVQPGLAISVSVGAAASRTRPDQLFGAADGALYEAKRLGRDRAVTTVL